MNAKLKVCPSVGKTATLLIGLVKTLALVFNCTTLAPPSFPGYSFVTFPNLHWSGG